MGRRTGVEWESSAGGRGPFDSRGLTVLYLLSSVAAVIGAVWILAATPERLERDRDLTAATLCEDVPWEVSDCLWPNVFTVSDVQLYEGRGSDITATLTSPETGSWKIEFRNDGPVLVRLEDGDRVTGTVWRGALVRIEANGVVQDTVASPTTLAESNIALAIMLGPSGLLFGTACGWRLRRSSEPQPRRMMRALAWSAAGTAAIGLSVGMAVVWAGGWIWLIPSIALPLIVLTVGTSVYIARRSVTG